MLGNKLSVFFIFILFLAPLLLLQQDTSVVIPDNLDCEMVKYVLLAKANVMIGDDGIETIEQVMNGLPKAYLSTEYNIVSMLYSLFPPFYAFEINYILVHLIAYLGMYFLLSAYVLKDKQDGIYAHWISLCFACLPFYDIYGISQAGQPLLLYAILNIYYCKKLKTSFFIVLIFSLYSSLPHTGIFICLVIGVMMAYVLLMKKQIHIPFITLFVLLSLFYALWNYSLILSEINDTIVSIRTEWIRYYLTSEDAFKDVLSLLIRGQYHFPSRHKIILLIALPIAMMLSLYCKRFRIQLIGIILSILAIGVIYYLVRVETYGPLINKINFFRKFQIDRFYIFNSILWYLVFAICVSCLINIKNMLAIKRSYVKYLINLFIYILIICQLCYTITGNTMFINNTTALLNLSDHISYKEYFAERLFGKIHEFINRDPSTYRVISIGIDPSVALYNGFYTLDSCLSLYLASYKHQFRKIMENELNKTPYRKGYFDNWGCKCYLFVSEVAEKEFLYSKEKYSIKNLSINTKALYNLGGRYIFSAYEIDNALENNIVYLKKFTDPDSAWHVYLYKVNRNLEWEFVNSKTPILSLKGNKECKLWDVVTL